MNPEPSRTEEQLKKALIKLKIAQKTLHSLKEPVAIIGMACRFPGDVHSPDEFWQLLKLGRDGIIEVPNNRWPIEEYYDPDKSAPGKIYTRYGGFLKQDVNEFDADFFNLSPRESEDMDPQQRMLLEVCYEALEDAGIPTNAIKESDTAFFMGMMYNDYLRLLDQSINRDKITAYYASGNLFSAVIGRLSYFFGTHGPCIPVDTACSSSLVAIDLACQSLHLKQSKIALAGGINLTLKPESMVMECKANMLSEDGRCKTFDASADGFSHSEGCGVIVIKLLSEAQKDKDRIYAIIRGSAINHGGASGGLTVPSQTAEEALLRQALERSSLQPNDISYIEAHGTGTSLGDPIEVSAISAVYRGRSENLMLGSVKTNIGHTESAAGVAGLMKVILALKYEAIPPTINLNKLNPLIHLESIPASIPTQLTPWKTVEKPRRAGVSSFGFSGINAHVILEEAPKVETDNTDDSFLHIFTLSAKTDAALDALVQKYKGFLETTEESIADICFTANVCRTHGKYRLALIAKDLAELKSKLHNGDFIKGVAKNEQSFEISEDLSSISKAYIQGASIDWEKFHLNRSGRKISLPTYPFQRKRYLSEAAAPITATQKINQKLAAPIQQDNPVDVKTYVENIVKEVFKIDVAIEERTFYELGMDSLMAIELNKKLQSGLGDIGNLEPTATLDHPSVEQMTLHINELLKNKNTPSPTNQIISISEIISSDKWIVRQKKVDSPKLRLFCFPHAGGGPTAFSTWRAQIPNNVDLCIIQLPGREMRRNEPPLNNLESIIFGITQAMLKYNQIPYIIFGHSLGCHLAIEVVKKFCQLKVNLPIHIILSGSSPDVSELINDTVDKTDEELLEIIKTRYGGISTEHLENPLIVNDFLRVLKADANLLHSLTPIKEKLNIPITTIYSTEDQVVKENKVNDWSLLTFSMYKSIKIPGTHLEILNTPEPFINVVKEVINEYEK